MMSIESHFIPLHSYDTRSIRSSNLYEAFLATGMRQNQLINEFNFPNLSKEFTYVEGMR